MKFLASNLDLVLGRPYKFSISEKEYQLTFNVRITWKKICDIIMFPIFWRYFFICISLNPFLGFKIITFEGLVVNSVSPDDKDEKRRIRAVDGSPWAYEFRPNLCMRLSTFEEKLVILLFWKPILIATKKDISFVNCTIWRCIGNSKLSSQSLCLICSNSLVICSIKSSGSLNFSTRCVSLCVGSLALWDSQYLKH